MKDIAKFIFEAGTLKRTKRAWLKAEGVPNPESVADHNFRVILLGYIMAKFENADTGKVMEMCTFHEMPETRIGDLDKIAQRYLNKDNVEVEIFDHQASVFPEKVSKELSAMFKELSERKTKEAIIARDADILELLFQAKEYADAGYHGCLYWLDKNSGLLKTDTAKKLFAELMKMNATEWWKGLENLR
jgi:putative hydrolase of HD superfamily